MQPHENEITEMAKQVHEALTILDTAEAKSRSVEKERKIAKAANTNDSVAERGFQN